MAEVVQQYDDAAANVGNKMASPQVSEVVNWMTKSPCLLKFSQTPADTHLAYKGMNPNNEACFSPHFRNSPHLSLR